MTISIQQEDLAKAFRAEALGQLGFETCEKIDAINQERQDASCASHDFCDANMLMLDAAEKLGLIMFPDEEPYEGFQEEVTDLCNRSWTQVKLEGFSK